MLVSETELYIFVVSCVLFRCFQLSKRFTFFSLYLVTKIVFKMANLPLDSTLIQNELEKWSTSQGTNDSTLVSLTTKICELLRQNKTFLELDVFLKLLPLEKEDVYLNNELIARAKIALAFEERNYPLIYNLIEVRNILVLRFIGKKP